MNTLNRMIVMTMMIVLIACSIIGTSALTLASATHRQHPPTPIVTVDPPTTLPIITATETTIITAEPTTSDSIPIAAILPVASPFALDADAACASCCDGGSCSYTTSSPFSPTVAPHTMVKQVQCCGKMENKPQCCAANQPLRGEQHKCAAGDNGRYVCRDARSSFRMLTEVGYLSPGGLVVIVIIGSMAVCCYLALAGRRSHAHYNGQPYYNNQPGYNNGYNNGGGGGYSTGGGGGGGIGGGGICAACLAGFCCTELCCTGNLNF